MFQDMRMDVNREQNAAIMRDLDRNGDGVVSFSEFMKLLPNIKQGKYKHLGVGSGGGGGGGGGGGAAAAPKVPADPGPGGLPPGWNKATAPDGRTYYFHKATGKTSWTVPAGGGGGGSLPPAPAKAAAPAAAGGTFIFF